MSSDPRIVLLNRLCAVAADQVEAALKMDVAALQTHNIQYGELVFELGMVQSQDVTRSEESLAEITECRRRLELHQERLSGISHSVLGVMHKIIPSGLQPTYSRTGQLG